MKNGLSGVKNLIWALAIFVSLLALLVGLVFSIATKYYGDDMDGTLVLGQGVSISKDSGIDNAMGQNIQPGNLLELPATQDNGIESVFNFTYLCDSTIIGINDYSTAYGGNATAQLWTDNGGGIPAASAATTQIVYPGDGSMVTPSNAAMVAQPKRLVIYIGGDDLAAATEDSFKAGYTQLIKSISSASPETKIICASIASVSAAYPSSDGLTRDLVSQANEWIKDVSIQTGSYYADLASIFNDEGGYLNADYASPDGRSLNSAGIAKLVEYFRFHGI
jgi:lysophospholipase L1-like esterase